MHKCTFCHDIFNPRPQVKDPKACSKCQSLRRQANQKAWHFKNKTGFDSRYHKLQRELRNKQLQEICNTLCGALRVGLQFQGKELNLPLMEQLFFEFLQKFGLRRANNLWTPKTS
jgi:hypothetical protein